MKKFASFDIAVSALFTHKTRTFLASLGILIGIASVVIMVAIGKGSQQEDGRKLLFLLVIKKEVCSRLSARTFSVGKRKEKGCVGRRNLST